MGDTLLLPLSDAAIVNVAVRDRVRVLAPLALGLSVPEPLTLPEKLPELEAEWLPVGLSDADEVAQGLPDADTEADAEMEPLSVGAAEFVEDGEGLAAPVPLAASEMDQLQVAVMVTRRDSLGVTVGEKEGLSEALALGVSLPLAAGLKLGLALLLGAPDADALRLLLALLLGRVEPEGEPECDALAHNVAEALLLPAALPVPMEGVEMDVAEAHSESLGLPEKLPLPLLLGEPLLLLLPLAEAHALEEGEGEAPEEAEALSEAEPVPVALGLREGLAVVVPPRAVEGEGVLVEE